jgi:hypothetical protein
MGDGMAPGIGAGGAVIVEGIGPGDAAGSLPAGVGENPPSHAIIATPTAPSATRPAKRERLAITSPSSARPRGSFAKSTGPPTAV